MNLTSKIQVIREVEEVEKLLNTKSLKKYLQAKLRTFKGINERVFQEKASTEVQALDNQTLNMSKHIQVEEKEQQEAQWLDLVMGEVLSNTMEEVLKHLLGVHNIQAASNTQEDHNLQEDNS